MAGAADGSASRHPFVRAAGDINAGAAFRVSRVRVWWTCRLCTATVLTRVHGCVVAPQWCVWYLGCGGGPSSGVFLRFYTLGVRQPGDCACLYAHVLALTSAWCNDTSYVVASIVSFLVFLSIAMYTANVPGRWDLPDTSHRRTSRIGLFARLGPRDKAHALSQASALHAALTVVAKATVGITSLVFAKAAAGSSLQAVGAWVMVALCIAWVVSTVWLRPMMSWHSQTVIVALQCAIVWVFTAGALWHSCVAFDDASDACEPGFGTPGAFSWAALVFGIAVFVQVMHTVHTVRCSLVPLTHRCHVPRLANVCVRARVCTCVCVCVGTGGAMASVRNGPPERCARVHQLRRQPCSTKGAAPFTLRRRQHPPVPRASPGSPHVKQGQRRHQQPVEARAASGASGVVGRRRRAECASEQWLDWSCGRVVCAITACHAQQSFAFSNSRSDSVQRVHRSLGFRRKLHLTAAGW